MDTDRNKPSFEEVTKRLQYDLNRLKSSDEIDNQYFMIIEQVINEWCTKPPKRPNPWNPDEFLLYVRKDLIDKVIESKIHPASIIIIWIIKGLTIQDAY